MSNSFNINPWDPVIESYVEGLNLDYGNFDFLSNSFEESQKLFDRDPEGYMSKSFSSYYGQTSTFDYSLFGNTGNYLAKSLNASSCNYKSKEFLENSNINLSKKNLIKMAKSPDKRGKLETIVQNATPEEIKALWNLIGGEFYSLSTHKYGCRFIQTLLKNDKYFPIEHIEKLKHEQIFELISCPHGNHVMQLITNCMSFMDLHLILDILLTQPDLIFKAAKNQCGSRVIELMVKKILHFCSDKNNDNEIVRISAIGLADKFLSIFKPYSKRLMCDNYGNFIVSYFVSYICPELQEKQRHYYDVVIENIIELSLDTYGSRIVEKVLTSENSVIALCAYTTFVNNLEKDRDLVVKFMEHGIGNYVLQKILHVGDVLFYGNINFKITNIMKKEAHVLDKFSKAGNLLKWIC
ncbi:Pumilio RNA-binding repeat and Armadillo-like helical domain and Armadillo-type fold domain-containing protein [Strongyloides ratti]|uniref:Pumilio RNA-binding repeat and Armadillo-like helical domain and Armadillo-type fold domain-containing protein n=1 Tax=Strongyloides ratti TaxID=34506 RepID=A0A090LD80_STRRB|nr:Pumilio RNA-binding repeat and Armadillo-like helical domain and Armadillo-type fold domain-containing protein [Strongyloides ratti]CEF67721.1 Pumilio RNA-binding repeat and Armadillo-like helical domain and Armadillo-type fold domain-containing protein [Strongyloides ratti]